MGYCYDYGTNRLSCDNCGHSGGVRKRSCKFKVLTSATRGQGRYTLNYCYPPAYCAACYKLRGGVKLHDKCREGAARSQATYDAEQARLEAGDAMITCRRGSHSRNNVPTGQYEATFVDINGRETVLVLLDTPDHKNYPDWLSDAPDYIVTNCAPQGSLQG